MLEVSILEQKKKRRFHEINRTFLCIVIFDIIILSTALK
jgi:hypothetical protein